MKEMPCNQCKTRDRCEGECGELTNFLRGTTKAGSELPCSRLGILNPEPLSVKSSVVFKSGLSTSETHPKKRERMAKVKSMEGLSTRQKVELIAENNTSVDMTHEEIAEGLGVTSRTLRRDLEKLAKKKS
jgi:hypothetical protein